MTLALASSLGDSVATWVKLREARNSSDLAAENRVCLLGCMAELASHVQPQLLRRQSPRWVPEGLSLAPGTPGFAPEAAWGLRGVAPQGTSARGGLSTGVVHSTLGVPLGVPRAPLHVPLCRGHRVQLNPVVTGQWPGRSRKLSTGVGRGQRWAPLSWPRSPACRVPRCKHAGWLREPRAHGLPADICLLALQDGPPPWRLPAASTSLGTPGPRLAAPAPTPGLLSLPPSESLARLAAQSPHLRQDPSATPDPPVCTAVWFPAPRSRVTLHQRGQLTVASAHSPFLRSTFADGTQ